MRRVAADEGTEAFVGVDLGTSAVKVLAVTTTGRAVAAASEFYALETPQPEFVEQDADAVYLATMRVLERVLADVRMRGSDVTAIGLSSAMHGLVAVDESGKPMSRVITWMDRRSGAIADGWRADASDAAGGEAALAGGERRRALPARAPLRRSQRTGHLSLDR